MKSTLQNTSVVEVGVFTVVVRVVVGVVVVLVVVGLVLVLFVVVVLVEDNLWALSPSFSKSVCLKSSRFTCNVSLKTVSNHWSLTFLLATSPDTGVVGCCFCRVGAGSFGLFADSTCIIDHTNINIEMCMSLWRPVRLIIWKEERYVIFLGVKLTVSK